MDKLPDRNYGKIVFLCCYVLITIVDIIYSVFVPSHNFTTGFLSILLAIEFPYLKQYLKENEYNSVYISLFILCLSLGIYFLTVNNLLSSIIMALVGLLITVRKNTNINH